jgi:hypothetical protein
LQPLKTGLKVYNPQTGFEWIVTDCNPAAGLEPGYMHLTQVLQATKNWDLGTAWDRLSDDTTHPGFFRHNKTSKLIKCTLKKPFLSLLA